jgi:hypothetical protein
MEFFFNKMNFNKCIHDGSGKEVEEAKWNNEFE